MPGARAVDGASRVDQQVRHRDELADGDLAHDDVVRVRQEVRRLGMLACERPEDELRHRHVGGRVDPVPGDVAEHDRQPAVGELHEVEDVAADVDLRRRLVDRPDLEARHVGPLARQQRLLHRLGELLLLLVEACVVDRECSLLRDRPRGRERVRVDRLGRVEREDRQLGEQLAGGRDREQRRRRPLLEERRQERMRASEARRRRDVEQQRLLGARRTPLRPLEDRAHGSCEPRVGDVHGTRRELVATLVGNADHRGVDVEHRRRSSP